MSVSRRSETERTQARTINTTRLTVSEQGGISPFVGARRPSLRLARVLLELGSGAGVSKGPSESTCDLRPRSTPKPTRKRKRMNAAAKAEEREGGNRGSRPSPPQPLGRVEWIADVRGTSASWARRSRGEEADVGGCAVYMRGWLGSRLSVELLGGRLTAATHDRTGEVWAVSLPLAENTTGNRPTPLTEQS